MSWTIERIRRLVAEWDLGPSFAGGPPWTDTMREEWALQLLRLRCLLWAPIWVERVSSIAADGPPPGIGFNVGDFTAVNTPRLSWGDEVVIYVMASKEALADRRTLMLDKFRTAVSVLQPAFGLVDLFYPTVYEEAGKDIRTRAWGVTLLGPAQRRLVGEERVKDCPAAHLEEVGGVTWIQAEPDPFRKDEKARRAIEEHLRLATAFAGTEPFLVQPPLQP